MWIGGAEGTGYRYEVIALVDGYVVQMRDLSTGVVDAAETRLFRTARVAFAHAHAMAAIDRFAATLLDMQDAASERRDAQRSEQTLRALKEQLNDEGSLYAPPPEQTPSSCVYH